MKQTPIGRALAGITVGPQVSVDNLRMFPLMGPSVKSVDYITLDDALAGNLSEVTEVSDHGVVPQLRVVNRGRQPMLILDGEELVGAKQNRVVNLTILVAAGSTLTIPVSCVEAGRWRAQSKAFSAAPRAQYAGGRAKRMAQVSRSMALGGAPVSDQSAVWADIADTSARMHSSSPTSAMEQIFIDHSASIDDYVIGCRPLEGQLGAVFAIGDRIVGFDLFDDAGTFRKLLPKIVRSYAVDAIDAGNASVPATRSSVAHLVPGFLAALAAASQQCVAAVGLGEDVRLSAGGLVGAGLVVDGRVLHLSGFNA